MEQYDYINNANHSSPDFFANGILPESEMQSNTNLGGTSVRPLGANAHSMEESKSIPQGGPAGLMQRSQSDAFPPTN